MLASDVVDVYDDATGTWSSARLSLPRSSLAVPALADRLLIAGGAFGGQVTVPSNRVDIYQVPLPGPLTESVGLLARRAQTAAVSVP